MVYSRDYSSKLVIPAIIRLSKSAIKISYYNKPD